MDGCSAADAYEVIRKQKTSKQAKGQSRNFMGNTPVEGSWFTPGFPARR
jgi:hypothetical protein